jgi:hypothetical protein
LAGGELSAGWTGPLFQWRRPTRPFFRPVRRTDAAACVSYAAASGQCGPAGRPAGLELDDADSTIAGGSHGRGQPLNDFTSCHNSLGRLQFNCCCLCCRLSGGGGGAQPIAASKQKGSRPNSRDLIHCSLDTAAGVAHDLGGRRTHMVPGGRMRVGLANWPPPSSPARWWSVAHRRRLLSCWHGIGGACRCAPARSDHSVARPKCIPPN